MLPIRTFVTAVLLAVSVDISAATFTVTSGGDSGPGTLRQAILDANANPGRDRIQITVPLVSMQSPHPGLTDPVEIDGALGDGGRAEIRSVDPTFHFLTGSSTSRLANTLLQIALLSVHVEADVTDVVIVDNTLGAVAIEGPRTVLERNTFPLYNRQISISGTGTVMRENTSTSMLWIASNSNAVIESNTFTGIKLSPTAIEVVYRPGIQRTTIRDNSIDQFYYRAILVRSGSGVEITGNRIVNAEMAIELGTDGPTPNDPAPDADAGANNLQNYPVLTSAVLHADSLVGLGNADQRAASALPRRAVRRHPAQAKCAEPARCLRRDHGRNRRSVLHPNDRRTAAGRASVHLVHPVALAAVTLTRISR